MFTKNNKLFSLLTFTTIFLLSGCGLEDVSADLSTKTPDMSVSCSKMLSEVEANETRAAKKYENKIIQISGYVDSVDEDLWGDPQINLSSGGEWDFNSCTLGGVSESKAISLDKGDAVTFTCNNFMEVIGSASLSNCSSS